MIDTIYTVVGILSVIAGMFFGYMKLDAESKKRFAESESAAMRERAENRRLESEEQQKFQDRLTRRDKEMGETIARLEERIKHLQEQLDAEISTRRETERLLAKAEAKLSALEP